VAGASPDASPESSVVTGKDFEEYVKMFLAEFSNIA